MLQVGQTRSELFQPIDGAFGAGSRPEQSFDFSLFSDVSREAVDRACQVLTGFQTGERDWGDTRLKRDRTFVSKADETSGQILRSMLKAAFPRVAQSIEDVKEEAGPRENMLFLVDPLDGTYGFKVGVPTSTVIIAAYDCTQNQVVACRIGDWATGRQWYADRESGGVFREWDRGVPPSAPVHVWQGELNPIAATIFIDVTHEFSRKSRESASEGDQMRVILDQGQMGRLVDKLSHNAKVLIPGSNGFQQAMIANGGEGIAGGITTAIGGPYDVCGILLVTKAGGVARAFSVEEFRGQRFLKEQDPMDVLSYDLAVYGNSKATVDRLCDVLCTSTKLGIN